MKNKMIVKYFYDKDISPLKIKTFIWLSDRLHLRKYARLITSYQFYVPNNHITSIELERCLKMLKFDLNLNVFSKTDIECMELVYNEYNHLTDNKLLKLILTFPELLHVKINPMIYFENHKSERLFIDDENNLKISTELFVNLI